MKYMTENEFLILTDLKFWHFFSSRGKGKVINEEPITLKEFYEDFGRALDLIDYIERIELRSIRTPLDKQFFKSLTFWVSQLKSVKFREEVSDNEKMYSIINLINKFIFIQTLVDYLVIDAKWIQKKWQEKKNAWAQKVREKS